MIRLSDETLARLPADVRVPKFDRSRLRPGIVHIGVGNFHRVHQALAIQRCLEEPGNEGWAICGLGILANEAGRAKAAAFRRQDCLYTITEFAADGSAKVEVIGAMIDYIYAPDDTEAALRRLASAETRIVSLTITEGGYDLDRAMAESGGPGNPRTAFDYIVEALERRRREDRPPFTVMSCDNLRANGDATRAVTLALAQRRDAGLARWIEANGAFPNSMVDRIAPKVGEADRRSLNAFSGIDDAVPASCETYNNWVMQDRFCNGRPPFDRAGVSLREDVDAFVAVKQRLSNAAHMLMCYPSLLLGYRLVNEAMKDRRLEKLLRDFWTIDAIPLVSAPPGLSPQVFTNQVIERFANLGINDQLERVASDGVSKILVFHSRNLADLIAAGKSLDRVAFLLACFGRYLSGQDDRSMPFKVDEPRLSDADRSLVAGGDPFAALKLGPFAELRLIESSAFQAAFSNFSAALATQGTSQVLTDLVGLPA